MPGPEQETTRSARLAQERSRERRQRLLEAALDLLVTQGRGSITHRSVAAAADVSVSSVGYYFPSIEDLVNETITHDLAAWRAVFDDLAESPMASVEDVMSRFAALVGDGSHEERLRAWQIYVEAVRAPATSAALADTIAAIHRALVHVLGDLDLDPRLPDLIMVAITGTSLLALGKKDSNQQMVEALVSAVGSFIDVADPTAKTLRVTLESFEDD